ncbi:MAG: GNAT family N-acetyltransferase [Steroidobacteraceae bacterium]
MTVSLRDARANLRDREWIESVYRDYLDDLGVLNTGIFPALGEIGHREPDQLQRWLVDRSATLLTILDDQQPAGFAMVARETQASRATDFRMAEFFVARGMRRRGLGRSAVRLIFDRFAGRWEILEYSRNPAAVSFWRNVVSAYTRGDYRERCTSGEVRQYFSSAQPRPAG